ncbi:GNAT family N-acetyltransferase [Halobacillus litoralis]|uniref:GNAT family N-acetyltransferase n=1 Tax=Halobacillus litoralis TaxID=45668 RepID=UPI001CD60D7F|nr:GNAT family N-acetyltransferase [Halobacillus litoralis]MCA0971830.1 GNAT family N-acetyltransferase [Halobacillus litoralis]
MIRLLTEQDQKACERLLLQKPAENLFLISDIENFGFHQDFQKLWGEYNDDRELIAVLLKYRSNYICYADQPFDAERFGQIISEDPDFRELSGLDEMTKLILPHIDRNKKHSRHLYYAKMDTLEPFPFPKRDQDVKLAGLNDVPNIAKLHDQIDDFEESDTREDDLRAGMENHSSRTYVIQDGGHFVSAASTTAENSAAAMVVGVCTHPDHTQKGYASLIMNRLCEDLLAEGKSLCLFYDNPKAGTIYKRLGFKDIGSWTMHLFEPQKTAVDA